jgi:F-box protein 9
MDDMSNLLNLRISTPGELGQLADDELERFRKEWKQEVQAKHSVPTGGVSVGGVRWKEEARIAASSREQAEDTVGTKSSPVNVRSPLQAQRAFPPDLDGVDVGPSWRAVPPPATIKRDKHKPSTAMSSTAGTGTDRKEQAVQLYSRAVESEQAGKLNEALMLYRKAFKLDGAPFTQLVMDILTVADNVDRLYARSVAKAAALALPKSGDETPTSADVVSSAAPVEEPYSFQRHIQIHPDYERAIPPPHTPSVPSPSPLTALLQSLPIPADQTQFLPSDESLPTPISILPPELIDPILAHLDVASIERFALTCWRARYLTACADVWKGIAEGIYKGPAMVPEGWMARELARRHKGEWRTTLVEEERLRMDGCYISVCHYM